MADARLLYRGLRGPDVARLQRRLARHGFHTRADGMFGPATAAALRAFQQSAGLAADGIAGPLTWAALNAAPAAELPADNSGLAPRPHRAAGLADTTLDIALAELAAGAREQGGNNRGEWVRKYMGVEGLPWCVGFATWCYRRACAKRGVAPVLAERWSSSRLVREARSLRLVVDPAAAADGTARRELSRVQPGHFFVLRGGPTGYSHTGIVRSLGWAAAPASAGPDPTGRINRSLEHITTVEGNTRLRGEAAADRVVTRFRATAALVFIAY